MNSPHETMTPVNSRSGPHWLREMTAQKLAAYEERPKDVSQRQWASMNNVPRSTLQNWQNRKDHLAVPAEVATFFESEAGLEWLHIMVLALHVSFSKAGSASVRNIVDFLHQSGLNEFVASSVGYHHKLSCQLDEQMAIYGQEETQRLAKTMPEKNIALAEDETFHPQTCLVAIEPESNYIVMEKYVPKRDGRTWYEAVAQGLKGLPVKVVLVISDEGKAIIHHAQKMLGVHRSSDLFHVSYEVVKAVSLSLAAAVRDAKQKHTRAMEKTPQPKYSKVRIEPVGRLAREQEQTRKVLENAERNAEDAKEGNAGIGKSYHPYDPETGRKQSPETVKERLDQCFDKVEKAASSLGGRCHKRIAKARRVVPNMIATIAFFFDFMTRAIVDLRLVQPLERLMFDILMPACYLRLAAQRERNPEQKRKIAETSKRLLSEFRQRAGPYCTEPGVMEGLEAKAWRLAHLFQRASSCVEGRNAHLSRYHQGLHRLNDRKLVGLTIIHNFYIKRPDGTSAAERFFEGRPKDLFDWLVGNIQVPARPRKRKTVWLYIEIATENSGSNTAETWKITMISSETYDI